MNLTIADATLPLIKGYNENGKGNEAIDVMSLAFVLPLLKINYTSQKNPKKTISEHLRKTSLLGLRGAFHLLLCSACHIGLFQKKKKRGKKILALTCMGKP